LRGVAAACAGKRHRVARSKSCSTAADRITFRGQQSAPPPPGNSGAGGGCGQAEGLAAAGLRILSPASLLALALQRRLLTVEHVDENDKACLYLVGAASSGFPIACCLSLPALPPPAFSGRLSRCSVAPTDGQRTSPPPPLLSIPAPRSLSTSQQT
jgi:hypothetical protein